MSAKKAGDIMVPIDEYPTVDSSATVLDAATLLAESRSNSEQGKQPYQAVLVADKNGKIIGKLGQLAFLRALEPRSQVASDKDTLKKAGVSEAIMQTALDHMSVLQRRMSEMCLMAKTMSVQNVMHPFKEHIDVDAPICDVIHQMVEWQTLSVLITKHDHPVGLIRLSDLCDEAMARMRQTTISTDSED